MAEDKEFKVVDRRASSGSTDSSPDHTKSGDGFVMKDNPAEAIPSPTSVDFPTFIFSLATGAFINMGLAPDPSTGKAEVNLALAQQNIDILILLKEKTKGNLSSEEMQMLEALLSEAQLKYVEVSRTSGG